MRKIRNKRGLKVDKHEFEVILSKIMSTKEASKLWGINQDSIKRLARQNKIIARKLDPSDPKSPYVIWRDQPNPKGGNKS